MGFIEAFVFANFNGIVQTFDVRFRPFILVGLF